MFFSHVFSNAKMDSRVNGHTLLCLEELLGENYFRDAKETVKSGRHPAHQDHISIVHH